MESNLQALKSLLLKPPNQRDSLNLKVIASHISNIKFFESLKSSKAIFKDCCRYLTYEFIEGGKYLFREGDLGDKFYILLNGESAVHVSIGVELAAFREVFVFRAGSSFGELALIDNKPRAASIFAKTDCDLAVLDKTNYKRLLSSLMKEKRAKLLEFLQGVALFQSLTKGSILKLSYSFEEKFFKQFQTLFKEGERAEYLYLIREGELKISKNMKIDVIDTKSVHSNKGFLLKRQYSRIADLGVLSKGELVGVNDIETGAYSLTCSCLSKIATVLIISVSDFNKRIRDEETIDMISRHSVLRNSIHENSMKSIKKIITGRSSPYKKHIVEESHVRKSSFQTNPLMSRRRIRSDSMSLEDSEFEDITHYSFDSQVNKCKRAVSRGNYERKQAENMRKSSSVSREALRTKQAAANRLNLSRTNGRKSKPSCDANPSESPGVNKNGMKPKEIITFQLLMSHIKPFGRSERRKQSEALEPVTNIHTLNNRAKRLKNVCSIGFRTMNFQKND